MCSSYVTNLCIPWQSCSRPISLCSRRELAPIAYRRAVWAESFAVGSSLTALFFCVCPCRRLFYDHHHPASLTRSCCLGLGFIMRNNTRCSGHYRVAGWNEDGPKECQEACDYDSTCASYSLELNGGKGCFLFTAEAACTLEEGWVSGHKGV